MEWEPETYDEDPMVNAVLNVAASISQLATATEGLLYGLKYSHGNGMSIAEAIQVGAREVSDGLNRISAAIELKEDQ